MNEEKKKEDFMFLAENNDTNAPISVSIEKVMKLETILGEAFGEISALFMSQECKGTEIVMPSRKLEKILNKTIARIKKQTNK